MESVAAYREEHQPTRERTGGSTFKNPPGHSAWQLIDAAGCRGLRIGGAMVSEKHCNFLINADEASAEHIERARRDSACAGQGDQRHRSALGNHTPRRAVGRSTGWRGAGRAINNIRQFEGVFQCASLPTYLKPTGGASPGSPSGQKRPDSTPSCHSNSVTTRSCHSDLPAWQPSASN